MKRPDAAPSAGETTGSEVGRLVGFSDAFFAIIITLLVIEIRLPHFEEGSLGPTLISAWPSYTAFALAFVYVGVIWLNHHALFQRVKKVDPGLNRRNLVILGTSALMPFPTGVLAEALQSSSITDQRSAVVLYSVVAASMSLAWAPVFNHLERCRHSLAPGSPPGFFARQAYRPWVGLIAYVGASLAGWFISHWISLGIFVLMVLFHAHTSEGTSVRAISHKSRLR